jgi:predicted RNA methylase
MDTDLPLTNLTTLDYSNGDSVNDQNSPASEIPDESIFVSDKTAGYNEQPTLDFTGESQAEEKKPPFIPLPNTPDNFSGNYVAVSWKFEGDTIEAARFLLRSMTKEDRVETLAVMRNAGCTDPESYHRYLNELLALPKPKEQVAEPREFRPFGAWVDFNQRLSPTKRERANGDAIGILEKEREGSISEDERETLSRYSGFGGINVSDERGVLYDYYTSPPVAHLVWQLLEKSDGIKAGARVLEPSCGTGVFFEYAPQGKSLSLTGVELDRRTASIAKHLHPDGKAEILNMSFEAFNLSSRAGGFDHVIGNAPFGERGVDTAALDLEEEKSLDNYFVTRSLDNLKEGGTMALIVAPGVLKNKGNEAFRLGVSRKAEFLGAVKLPNRSFHHSNTQVTPDILLFRKYPEDIQKRLSTLDDEAFFLTPLCNIEFVKGNYFENHLDHIAGELSRGTGQWGVDEVKGDITSDSINAILKSFEPSNSVTEEAFEGIRQYVSLPVESNNKTFESLDDEDLQKLKEGKIGQGTIKIADNRVYLLSSNHWTLVSEKETLAKKLNACIAITENVRAIQEAMKAENSSSSIQDAQKQSIKAISSYAETYKAIPLEDQDLIRFTREHPSVKCIYEAFLRLDDPLLHDGNVYRKKVEILDGHNTAITALLMLQERLKDGTEENIRAFFPDTAESLMEEMKKHEDVFYAPSGCFELREDFIAGNAWEKIDALREAAKHEEMDWKKKEFLRGADELEKAVGWTPIEDADFSPRSSWIPQDIVRDWASSEDGLGQGHLDNLAKNDEGKWGVIYHGGWDEKADPLVYYLNAQKQRSNRIDTETYNKDHDGLFQSFIANHESYRALLESEYNRKFKTHIIAPVKTYPVEIAGWRDGSSGAGKTLKPHQWQSVHHLYRQGRGISALGTGFGKTATAISLISLLRQEGKSHRVFLQVPNNKVKDWVAEIKDVMPSLKISSIDPEDSGYGNRDRRYAKYQGMARSNADIIIMPENSASEIQLTPENDSLVTRKIAARYQMEKESGTERQQQLAAIKGERKARSGKTNATISFEDFGCDALVVDEAHRYKNLFSSTLSRETGLNDGRQSAKAMSLYKKSEHIREQNNGKNVFLLTATPLTNSPLEYYNMMQYIAPEELKSMGVSTIDGFIHEFADIKTGWLYDWGSGQAKQGRILTGFKNLPTLQDLFFTYTDLQNNPDAVGIEKPLSENQPHVIPADKKQADAVKEISAELERYKSLKKAEEREAEFPGQNFLTFYTRMRTASLDLELYDPGSHKGWKNPKLADLSQNVFEINRNTGAGQVIFCDRVFSSDASFNIHEKIKDELVSQGFKDKEIVVVNGFTKSGGAKSDSAVEKEVSKAIEDFNSGKYKVIVGSTACIGEGVNLQKNSSAVHHFDIPFRPSDFIQRNGRVDRQGNSQEKVGLHTYLAAGTIDNYSVNLVQRKANWIDQLLRTKSQVFTNPNDENSIDADELLLALTEEWGDKKAAAERRAEIERQKQEKILEAQALQMKGHLKKLSLVRGAIQPLEGKEHTKEYKKLSGQMANIEAALKNNPAFNRHDILDGKEAFLYNADTGNIFRKDDILVKQNGRYTVAGFNFKKQELVLSPIESDEEIKERKTQQIVYGRRYTPEYTMEKVSSLKSPDSGYYSALLYHLEKPSKAEREVVRLAGSTEFYNLPEGVKEKNYQMHVDINEGYGRKFHPVVFFRNSDNSLEIQSAYCLPDDITVINPFSNEGKKTILDGIENGIRYSKYEKTNIVECLEATLPDFAKPVQRAIEKYEEIEHENKAALHAAFENESYARLGASKDHVKSHVYIVR